MDERIGKKFSSQIQKSRFSPSFKLTTNHSTKQFPHFPRKNNSLLLPHSPNKFNKVNENLGERETVFFSEKDKNEETKTLQVKKYFDFSSNKLSNEINSNNLNNTNISNFNVGNNINTSKNSNLIVSFQQEAKSFNNNYNSVIDNEKSIRSSFKRPTRDKIEEEDVKLNISETVKNFNYYYPKFNVDEIIENYNKIRFKQYKFKKQRKKASSFLKFISRRRLSIVSPKKFPRLSEIIKQINN